MTKKKEEFTTETIKVKGKKVVDKVNELVRAGNVRSVIVKDKHGKTIVQFPMLLGVAGAVIAPIIASLGLIAFFIAECTLIVERKKD